MRLNALYSGSQEVEGLWEALSRLLKAAVPMPRTRAPGFHHLRGVVGLDCGVYSQLVRQARLV